MSDVLIYLWLCGLFRSKWEENEKIDRNYENLGLAADVNSRRGRNSRGASIDANVAGIDNAILDEDFTAAMGHMRSSGKAPPQRPTPRQRSIVQRLVDAHGNDVDAMTKDRKLNSMQHSKGQLIKLIESCKHWSQGAALRGVDFRVPNKRLW